MRANPCYANRSRSVAESASEKNAGLIVELMVSASEKNAGLVVVPTRAELRAAANVVCAKFRDPLGAEPRRASAGLHSERLAPALRQREDPVCRRATTP